MKITHKEYKRRYGYKVPIDQIRDGDVFVLAYWAGGKASLMWQGARYNLSPHLKCSWPQDNAYGWKKKQIDKEWESLRAEIVDPTPYLDVIKEIKDKFP